MEKRRDSVTDHGKQFRERPSVAPEREIADEQEATQELALPVRQSLQAQFGRAEVDMALSGEDTSPFGTFILSEWAMGAAGLGSLTDTSPEGAAQVHGMLHSQEWGEASAGIISRYASSNEPAHAHLAIELIRRSRGQRLPADVASRLSAALGVDISDAIVHTDTAAAQAADAVNAHAFATGKDVFFAAGKYQPGTKDGDELLAHELTHVVQDAEGRIPFSSGEGLTVSTPNQSHEREAERAGRDAASLLHDSTIDIAAEDGLVAEDMSSMAAPDVAHDVALHRQESAEGPGEASEDGQKSSGWGETQWTNFFEEEIVALSDAKTAQRVLYHESNRKRFDKSIWDAHCIHMNRDDGDMYERLNKISRTMPKEEFIAEIRPSIKRGVEWVSEQNEMLIEALEDRKFNVVTRLLNDRETLRSRMDFVVAERDTFFGALSDFLNWNASVPEQVTAFEQADRELLSRVDTMHSLLDGLHNYLESGVIDEEFDAAFDVDTFDSRGVGVQDVTTSFVPYIDAHLSVDHAAARDALGTMMYSVHEAIYAIEFGAEVGEFASKVALEEAKLILSVWAGLHVSSSMAAAGRTSPTVLEKASRLWAIDMGASIGKRGGEAMVMSDDLTTGELLAKFATDVGSDAAVSAICRIWGGSLNHSTKSMQRVLELDFNRRVGESTAKAVLRHLTMETARRTPEKLVVDEFRAALETRLQGEKVDAKAADEILAKVVRSEAAKPWIKEALKMVLAAESQ